MILLIIIVVLSFAWGAYDKKRRAKLLAEAEAAQGRKLRLTHMTWFGSSWKLETSNWLVKGLPWWAYLIGLVLVIFYPYAMFLPWLGYIILTAGFSFGQGIFQPVDETQPAQEGGSM